MNRLKALFATPEDPYAGGDLDNARRIGSIFWGMLVVLTIALFPLSPPTEAVGGIGWAIGGLVALTGAVIVYLTRKTELLASWDVMLALACGSVIGMALLQWLAGGIEPPYKSLLLLSVLFVGAIHPPRRILFFLGFVLLALAAPFVYDHWDPNRAGNDAASFVIWCAIALLALVLMNVVRSQRLSLAQGREQALEEARLDPLTGLRNRRAFDEASEFEIARARRLGVPLSLVLLDIDKFKQVNDDFGHLEGDRCLREVAITLRRELRQPDLCFRWGGDEFALLLSGSDHEGAVVLGNRVVSAVAAHCERPNGEPVAIEFGVSELRGDMVLRELVEIADLGLAAAKSEHAGR